MLYIRKPSEHQKEVGFMIFFKIDIVDIAIVVFGSFNLLTQNKQY